MVGILGLDNLTPDKDHQLILSSLTSSWLVRLGPGGGGITLPLTECVAGQHAGNNREGSSLT